MKIVLELLKLQFMTLSLWSFEKSPFLETIMLKEMCSLFCEEEMWAPKRSFKAGRVYLFTAYWIFFC